MTPWRRLVLLLALMFWQGGFMFYGAVVVPVGSEVLGSHTTQGFITRQVTVYLNIAGVVTMALWAWELMVIEARGFSWLPWSVLVLTLGGQFDMWQKLDSFLDPTQMTVLDPDRFRQWHAGYLILSTFKWVVAVGLLTWMIRLWSRPGS